MSFDNLTTRITAEYRDLPGLSLTLAQACRLWHLDPATGERALAALVARGSLYRTPQGRYVALPRPGVPAKAALTGPRVAKTAS
jgi:hypothetical protein